MCRGEAAGCDDQTRRPRNCREARAQRRPSRAAAMLAGKAGLLEGLPSRAQGSGLHCGAPGRAEAPAGGPPPPRPTAAPYPAWGGPPRRVQGGRLPRAHRAPHLWCCMEVDGNKPPPASSILRCPENLPGRQRLQLTQPRHSRAETVHPTGHRGAEKAGEELRETSYLAVLSLACSNSFWMA